MNNPDGASAFDGREHHNPKADGPRPLESGVLPDDFGHRLERLKEVSGLSWRGWPALGADPKQLARWRKGVEPCAGPCTPFTASHPGCPAGRRSSWARTTR